MSTREKCRVIWLLAILMGSHAFAADDRLTFQTFPGWSPRVNLNADVAMVYGIDASLPRRMQSWRDHGYGVWAMTGVAWGSYQDYLSGKFDGKNHEDEAQTDAGGQPIRHGGQGDVYYMSPGENYGKYLATGVKHALDVGAQAVCLEEPEFWVNGGWEPSFRREWKAQFGQDWQPPDSSPEAQYRASKLKYLLYRRALSQVFDFVRQYGKEHGRQIPCYVATHSLLNYAHWRIVSPESSLLDVGCDGYIAQVWTGTSRTPNLYNGVFRERTFEAAFLEYGAMQNLVRASNRKVWYLNDPVEDNPGHTWADYKANWENTLVASLLQPEVWRYEVMPWPQRVFDGKYADGTGKHVGISHEYGTELQVVMSALADMKQPADSVAWQTAGTRGVGILVSDTMMFQRGSAGASDEHLSSFYGLALPLLKRGIPVEPVQIESAAAPGFLDRYKLLVLTYEGQKPPTPQFHAALAQWVRHGGALLVLDDDHDPFNAVGEWWNTGQLAFKSPRQHLFEQLGIPPDKTGPSAVDRGILRFEKISPASLAWAKDGSDRLIALARATADALKLPWSESSALVLRRGAYVVAAGLDETPQPADPLTLRGHFLDLFDPTLTPLEHFDIRPGTRALLLDLARLPAQPAVIAAACRVREEVVTDHALRFKFDGIADTTALVCIRTDHPPHEVRVNDQPLEPSRVRFEQGLLRIEFPSSPDPIAVQIVG
jgi:hypothetical protein